MALDGHLQNLSPQAANYLSRVESRLKTLSGSVSSLNTNVKYLTQRALNDTTRMKPGENGVPWAQSSGIEAPLALATNYTVTFPTGRFSVPPVILVSVFSGSTNSILSKAWVTSETEDQFTYRVDGGTYHSSLQVHWTALQMTVDTANG